ncbi:hypothetical protein RSOL_085420 [Rhizoctonia solani AG-3 Rhs1AP]|uniref:Uncharacterized protein n=2 Tax=Rhizoctonia solani AG-3 TaxID=1086053 RepID=A0A074RR62_9AGAM|nr:hypothetical protein RSOL_085420 [Rhizoctonia solani AG-3 Rhs1AP]KEP49359.1 hypothetical protein V565_102060 [Rhizoctonia solani 123E]
MSTSSMLLPRRGASPARGLAKSNTNQQRTEDVNISSDPQNNRNARSRDSGWEQSGKNNACECDMARSNARMDHYSPPPETGDNLPSSMCIKCVASDILIFACLEHLNRAQEHSTSPQGSHAF